VNSELVGLADLVVGNEEDYAAALGLPLAAAEGDYSELDPAAYELMLGEVTSRYPGLRVAAVTLRRALSATRNDWSAICVAGGQAHRSTLRRELEVLDRVGGGDGFASGLIYGLLTGEAAGDALELGAAHGALAMTTPGDTSMATLEEVMRVASGGAVRIQR
jgi:2-dehydro-3-deoxygluconokinase